MAYSINTSDVPIHNLGRFGNHFFRNLVATYLAKKYDLKAKYHNHDLFKEMNLHFYEEGKNVYSDIKVLDDNNFMEILNNYELTKLPYRIILPEYYQSREFALFIKPYFDNNIKKYYDEHNKYYYYYLKIPSSMKRCHEIK